MEWGARELGRELGKGMKELGGNLGKGIRAREMDMGIVVRNWGQGNWEQEIGGNGNGIVKKEWN